MYAPGYGRLLLIALTCVAASLSACGNWTLYTPRPGEEKGAADGGAAGRPANGSGPSGGKLEACSQITKEEVEAALGGPLTEPVRGNELVSRKLGMLTSSCMFVSDQGFVGLNVRQQDPESTTAWNAAESYEELKGLIFKKEGGESPVSLEEVSGLGADAFAETMEETANYQTTSLRVLTKRTILTVRVNGPVSTPTLEAATMLAGKALSRLERYEGSAVAPRPRAPAARTAANRDADAQPATREGSQTARNSAGSVERERARKVSNVASARDRRGAPRTAREPDAKASRKGDSRTAERGKKEPPKTSRPNPKNRKRQ